VRWAIQNLHISLLTGRSWKLCRSVGMIRKRGLNSIATVSLMTSEICNVSMQIIRECEFLLSDIFGTSISSLSTKIKVIGLKYA
jgi:hypothetical protein